MHASESNRRVLRVEAIHALQSADDEASEIPIQLNQRRKWLQAQNGNNVLLLRAVSLPSGAGILHDETRRHVPCPVVGAHAAGHRQHQHQLHHARVRGDEPDTAGSHGPVATGVDHADIDDDARVRRTDLGDWQCEPGR